MVIGVYGVDNSQEIANCKLNLKGNLITENQHQLILDP